MKIGDIKNPLTSRLRVTVKKHITVRRSQMRPLFAGPVSMKKIIARKDTARVYNRTLIIYNKSTIVR